MLGLDTSHLYRCRGMHTAALTHTRLIPNSFLVMFLVTRHPGRLLLFLNHLVPLLTNGNAKILTKQQKQASSAGKSFGVSLVRPLEQTETHPPSAAKTSQSTCSLCMAQRTTSTCVCTVDHTLQKEPLATELLSQAGPGVSMTPSDPNLNVVGVVWNRKGSQVHTHFF